MTRDEIFLMKFMTYCFFALIMTLSQCKTPSEKKLNEKFKKTEESLDRGVDRYEDEAKAAEDRIKRLKKIAKKEKAILDEAEKRIEDGEDPNLVIEEALEKSELLDETGTLVVWCLPTVNQIMGTKPPYLIKVKLQGRPSEEEEGFKIDRSIEIDSLKNVSIEETVPFELLVITVLVLDAEGTLILNGRTQATLSPIKRINETRVKLKPIALLPKVEGEKEILENTSKEPEKKDIPNLPQLPLRESPQNKQEPENVDKDVSF